MGTGESEHRLADVLPDDAADAAGPAPDPAALAPLDRGLAGIPAGRVKTRGEYHRERGL